MTTTTSTDAADLRGFGYEPELRRSIGSYASFAAGFSFVSILTTVFQLFAFGFSFGGPAFFWTWPLVFLGQFTVALNFAELAARYPLSGCIYQWSRRLAGATVGWFAGWVMIIAQIVTVASAAIALQVVLPQIWSGFQLVGGDPSLTSTTGATNAVILGAILIALTTLVNVIGVRLMSIINSTGVTLEIIGVAAVVVLLLVHAERGPGVVLHTGGLGSGLSYVGPFLVSALMAAYVVVGFDSAGELSEETHDPRHTAPRTILRALAAAGIGGGLLLLVALMAAPSLTDGRLATEGLPYVLTSRLGETGGRILLIDVAIAVAVCTLAIQTAGSRMIFSMARDEVLPFSAALSRVNPRTGTPALPAIVVGVGAAALLLVNIGQAALFTALTSVCIVLLYLAYALVTIPLLVRRIKGWPVTGPDVTTTERGGRLFSLGRTGIVVNGVAVVYGLGMILNLGWPRAEVYDPAGAHWYLHYFSLLFVAATLIGGALAYARYRTRAMSLHLPSFPAVVAEGDPA
ncbi:amino acid permease [Actinoplanes sp. SE50]|uniref:amino acid permease n=1 Tax=unclassified Actinoplanes TaxID=2626549 RepID=UPI00023EC348|nr:MULTISPECIES: amino acid permease [unclassified Actinoplanes]AEV86998.1 putative amino-acid permease [Actinoplanes sp. SE50/110]ATO85394.1 amino acid permease [Actinoplanes sp. SE50]SLM02806.1 amino acid permease [Actinoplanes sp. SE50/110]